MKVGIVGLGVVGSGQVGMFKDCELVKYDPMMHPDYPGGMEYVDFAVVCVGTPSLADGRADLRAVYKAASDLPDRIPVALRSTVPPGTTDKLFHDRLYAHIPEFMGENTLHSWQRSTDVPYMIIGGDSKSALFFRQRFATVYPGKIVTCTAKEAELAKYAANLYWANRVTFVNEFAKICDAFDVDYEHMASGPAHVRALHPTRLIPTRLRWTLLAQGLICTYRRILRRGLRPGFPVRHSRGQCPLPGTF
jgi:UDPglucose 6-dehydrogenase